MENVRPISILPLTSNFSEINQTRLDTLMERLSRVSICCFPSGVNRGARQLSQEPLSRYAGALFTPSHHRPRTLHYHTQRVIQKSTVWKSFLIQSHPRLLLFCRYKYSVGGQLGRQRNGSSPVNCEFVIPLPQQVVEGCSLMYF